MLARTSKLLALLSAALPATGWAHAGVVPHVHPHEALLAVALVLALGVAAALLLGRRSAPGE